MKAVHAKKSPLSEENVYWIAQQVASVNQKVSFTAENLITDVLDQESAELTPRIGEVLAEYASSDALVQLLEQFDVRLGERARNRLEQK